MGEIWALAIKDLRVISRDKAAAFFLFVFPIAIAIFFGTIFAGGGEGPRDMTIAVVDLDNTEASRAFVESLDSEEGITLDRKSEEDARTAVRRGDVAAFILLPEGYAETQGGMFWGQSPGLEMGIDPSRRAEAAMIKGLLMKHSFSGMQEQYRDPKKLGEQFDKYIADVRAEADEDEEAAEWLPFLTLMREAFESLPAWDEGTDGGGGGDGEFDMSQMMQVKTTDVTREWEGPRSSYETSFPQGMLWGLLTSAAAFGVSLVVERTRGTLIRLRIAPISRAQILAGKGLACFMAMMAVMLTLTVIGIRFCGIRPSSYLHLAMAILCGCICFVGMMMFVSVLGKTEQSAGGFGWAIMVTMGMIGGASVPLFFMPPWLQKVSCISPVRWAALALEGSLWREFSFSEMLLPCGILVGIGLAFFCIGARAFKWIQE
jgi:ABC-2 type transport system permease protein